MHMKPCCAQPENLKVIEQRGDKIVRQCKVCNARHIEFAVDPIVVGVKLN
jgi:hypothetical protein